MLTELLYRPDRNSIEFKALEQAAVQAHLTIPKLLEQCGALPSSHDYHYGRFLFEYFPRGTGFVPRLRPPIPARWKPRKWRRSASTMRPQPKSTMRSRSAACERQLASRRPHRRARAGACGRIAPGCRSGKAAFDRLLPGQQDHHAAGSRDRRSTRCRRDANVRRCRCTWRSRRNWKSSATAARSNGSGLPRTCATTLWSRRSTRRHVTAGRGLPIRRRTAAAVATCDPAGTAPGQGGTGTSRARTTTSTWTTTASASSSASAARRSTRSSPRLMILVNTEWGRQLALNEIPALYRAQANGKVKMSHAAGAAPGAGRCRSTSGRVRRCAVTRTS